MIMFFIPRKGGVSLARALKMNLRHILIYIMGITITSHHSLLAQSSRCHILDLPKDILQRIPPSYRMWKLLQLTCKTLNTRLGDYHTNRELIFVTDCDTIISYKEAVIGIIKHMTCESASQQYYSLAKNEWFTCPHGNKWLNRNAVIIDWDTDTLYTYDKTNGYHCITTCDEYEDIKSDTIFIGSQRYRCGASSSSKILYEYIYNELPELYSRMYIVKRMTAKEFTRH